MSAPILYFKDAPSAPENAFGDICTEDFRKQLDKSPALIRESFEAMISMKERQETWSFLDRTFNTCSAIESAHDIEYLYEHLSNGYLYMAMTDYPYPANFLEPMPAWPVAESVKPFIDIPLINEPSLIEPIKSKVFSIADRLAQKLEKRTSKVTGGVTERE
jgi:lysosomal Pro-X carboxypeptidase